MIPIPPDIENYMEEYNSGDDSAYEQTTLKQFYEIKYGEVINAINFFKPDAVYSTDHGVKGEEYENVLFVMGRGWNLCKFEDSLYKDEKSLQGKELATYIGAQGLGDGIHGSHTAVLDEEGGAHADPRAAQPLKDGGQDVPEVGGH